MTDLLNMFLGESSSTTVENATPYKRRRMMDKITPLPKFKNTLRRLKRAHEQAKRLEILALL